MVSVLQPMLSQVNLARAAEQQRSASGAAQAQFARGGGKLRPPAAGRRRPVYEPMPPAEISWERVFETAPFGMAIVGGDGDVERANAKFRALTRPAAADAPAPAPAAPPADDDAAAAAAAAAAARDALDGERREKLRDVVERAARWRGPFGDAEAAVLAAARGSGDLRFVRRPNADDADALALAAHGLVDDDLGDAGAPGGGDGGDALDDDDGADARAGCVLAYVGDAALPPGEAPRAKRRKPPRPTGASLTLSTVDVDAPPPGEGPLDADEPKRKAPAHADRPPAKKAKKQPPPPPAHDDTAEPPPAKAPAAAKKAPKGKQASKKAAPKMAAKAKGKVLAKELPPAHDDDDDDDDDDGEPPTVTRGGRVSRPRGR
ncbi:hypothetical protein AURANDRAFT_62420 [Aureococcus anophagefferens]|uniref:Uncharacterized protein n=1 Tax=Aureococcus anophagefferens TaxID=44056 RepID=F0Y3G4_AURAN|nr:hypothetical protein AURANDRAFT_62420 [Aureococcus anophagefferens]EGB10575.1 hypothetical protein AURANDRAFT_62420 [Aureococcus anophagefferens]|eukprot:XP_009035356.1 hypothetical protein AURANDRAFT_62420 [Aureococcus anophagefferens]